MVFDEDWLMALDMNYVRDLVKDNQGEFSERDLTRALRRHCIGDGSVDPGFEFGTYVVAEMVRDGMLDLRENTDSSACTLRKCYVDVREN